MEASNEHYVAFPSGEAAPQTRPVRKLNRRWYLLPTLATCAVVGATAGYFYSQSGQVSELSALKLSTHELWEKHAEGEFERFKREHAKLYASLEEKAERYRIFKKNLAYIQDHNKQGRSYSVSLNKFADMTQEEFRATYAGFKKDKKHRTPGLLGAKREIFKGGDDFANFDRSKLKTKVDWRDQGCVSPPDNQGQCGACWAFAATGAIEGAACALLNTQLPSLSKQQLIDCASAEGNTGCGGGEMQLAFKYMLHNDGLCTEEAYPYASEELGQCKAKTCQAAVKLEGYQALPPEDESALLGALQTVGPVAVAVQADEMPFQFYSGGVFDGPCGHALDHAVLAVGFGVDEETGKEYFAIKNSWGQKWGESGFIRIARGAGTKKEGTCGVLLDPSYPILSKTQPKVEAPSPRPAEPKAEEKHAAASHETRGADKARVSGWDSAEVEEGEMYV